jgi:hypothetical protein
MTQPNTKPIAVIDTNVILDVISIHDLTREYGKPHDDLDAPNLIFRRARARESILAMIYLNKIEATTFNLHGELLEQLERYAPPGQDTPETYFVNTFLWFVKDHVLREWDWIIPTQPGEERGDAADQVLVNAAKEWGVPLITNEGFNAKGYGEGEIGERATAAGVTWYHPRKFYEGKIDETTEIEAFLGRCREKAPTYLAEHKQRHNDDSVATWLPLVLGSYRHVLLGDTEGRTTPVRVAI